VGPASLQNSYAVARGSVSSVPLWSFVHFVAWNVDRHVERGYGFAMKQNQEPTREITVVAAVIRDLEGRVLLTQRPQGRHMGGLWEFPGGKIGDGEGPAEALVRELDEELGLAVEIDRPLTFAVHEELGLRILLLFFGARILSGAPHGKEGQAVKWVSVSELPSYPTPPADAELVLRLANGSVP